MARAINLNKPDISPQLGDDLDGVGVTACEKFASDKDTMGPWLQRRANVRKLNAMLREPKSFPWHGASKGCVPIINVAVHQFQSRALPELIPAKRIVNVRHTGREDRLRALRVEKLMNDAIRRSRRYEAEMGNLLTQVALDGTAFRKTWFDEMDMEVKYKTIAASDVVCSYSFTGDIRDCRRITHVLWLTPDELNERVARKAYNKSAKDLPGGTQSGDDGNVYEDPIRAAARNIEGVVVGRDHDSRHDDITPSDAPRMILEQHTWLHLNGETATPVIISIDYETKQVLRIVSREYVEAGVAKIMHFFVKYDFFPNPDGFYGFGLGSLLENYNALANALVNMLVDAGTRENTEMGMMSSKAGLDRGDLMWRPGEIKVYDGMVSNIRDEFMLMPHNPPSQVLLALLGMIQGWGKEIASVNDIMQGLEQSANQTATTTITMVEQGLKLFSAVHKRIRASFKEELELTYLLHRMYLQDDVYQAVIGDDGSVEFAQYQQQLSQYQQMAMQMLPMMMQGMSGELPPPPEHPFSVARDFAIGYDVQPEADPEVVGQAQRLVVTKELYTTTLQNPHTQADVGIVREVLRRYYEAMGEQDIEQLLPQLPPPPQPPQQQDQWIENAQFIRGDVGKPFVFETDIHAEHLLKMEDLFADEAWERMEPDRKAAAEQHRAEHESYLYLQKKGMMDEPNQQSMAVPMAQGPGSGWFPGAGQLPGMVSEPGDTDLSATIGPGEALDNAPASLHGRFPLAEAARGA